MMERPGTLPPRPKVDADRPLGAFGDWLAGFIDGEGCFTIRKDQSGAYRTTFEINLRDDDARILRYIRGRTGIGTVRGRRTSGSDGIRRHNQCVWRVSSIPDCYRLITILDEHYLRARKARDYAVWRQAVLVRRNAAGSFTDRDRQVLQRLCSDLLDARRYERKGDDTQTDAPATPPGEST